MSLVLQATIASSAVLFIAVSAIMNALFLSSLGRTSVEIGLLAAVSIASDMMKAALPVLIMRAVSIRAWIHGAMAGVMLVIVVTLSLASGTGFAALTRNTAVTARDAQAETLGQRQKDLREIEAVIEGLAATRPTAVIEADIARLTVDRRWSLSKSCTNITGTPIRTFCTDVAAVRSELAVAATRDRLTAERSGTRTRIEALQTAGAGGDSDPQVAAIAGLFGVDPSTPRRVLPASIAIVLELGAVILVLLAAGPTVYAWREPGSGPPPPLRPAELPVQTDRAHWRRQQGKANLSGNGVGHHARS